VLFQHFFWFYSHPAVYIMIVPAMGVISEMVTTFSHKHIFGYRFIAYSSVALALFSFLVWGHHMFVSGQSRLANMVFSALTFSVGIPSAIKVFNWASTLYKGDIRLDTPMLYVLSFLILFTIGGLTGIFLAVLSIDVHLHDTYFVVAHFHYVMVGGTVIAFIGGIHHWWPKITGKMYNEAAGKLGALLVFIGFNVTFLTQFFMGHQGMPRRYYAYLPEYQLMHQISTVGAWILAVGLFLVLFTLIHALKYGERAGPNPWNAVSLEWHTSSPPIEHNFHHTPHVTGSPYDFPEIDKTGKH
jgi:cytochrome c oxidase subunit 1